MRKHPGLAIALALLCCLPAAAQLDLASDPLWRALSSDSLPAARLAGEGLDSLCTAQASCGSTTVSCSGSGTCTAVDQNCSADPQQPGYVTCDSVTTFCPTNCPPPPPPPEDCKQYNTPWCQYTWDAVRSCCVAGPRCPDTCAW